MFNEIGIDLLIVLGSILWTVLSTAKQIKDTHVPYVKKPLLLLPLPKHRQEGTPEFDKRFMPQER